MLDVNENHLPLNVSRPVLRILLTALSLSLLLAVTSIGAAAYDPSKPVSDRDADASPPPGGGPGSGRKIAMGVSVNDSHLQSTLDSWMAGVNGQAPATWSLWTQWGHKDAAQRDFPVAMSNVLKGRGIVPMIWWQPTEPGVWDEHLYPRYMNTVNGVHDDYIRQFALDAKAHGGPILLRYAYEFNNSVFPWRIGMWDNTPDTFKRAWRHVWNIFRGPGGVGADNVRFVWSVATKSCAGGCNPYTEVYPGDQYVDVMGFSSYNWGDFRDNWKSMADGYRRPINKFMQISDKPIMVAETGSASAGGNKRQWLLEGYPAVYEEFPRLKAIVYLDIDMSGGGHPDWSLNAPAGARPAYAELMARPEFQGKALFKVTASKSSKVKANADKSRKKAAERKKRLAEDAARVKKGTQVSKPPTKESTATNTTARKTTKRKKKDPPAPDPLDNFGR